MPIDYSISHLAAVYNEIFQELSKMGIQVFSRAMDVCALDRKERSTFANLRVEACDSDILDSVKWPELEQGVGCSISSERVERMKVPKNGYWFENT